MEYQNFHPHILPVYPFGFLPFHPQFNIPAWSDESPVPLDLPIWCNMFKMTSFHSLQAIEVPPRDTLDSQGRPFGCYTPDGRRKEWKKGERDVDTSTELSGADKLRGLKAAAMRRREAMKKKRESSRATEDDGPTEVISTNTTDLFILLLISLLLNTTASKLKAPLPPVSLPSQGPGIIQLCKTKRPPNTKAEATCDSYPVLLDHFIDLSLEETEELDFIPFPPSSPALSSHLPIVISSSPDNLSPPRHVDHTPSPKTIKSVTTQQKSLAHFVGNKDKKKKKKRSEKKLDSTQQGAAR
ncbi:hypothetical protein I203_108136 [Kwoniella mangroviensis CBS 8507]|uniref:hypothetical protein n=1 Tax=Kwoniella mangroviensis CBS 8507 TaxID=1296122 RepID=UPI00306F1B14